MATMEFDLHGYSWLGLAWRNEDNEHFKIFCIQRWSAEWLARQYAKNTKNRYIRYSKHIFFCSTHQYVVNLIINSTASSLKNEIIYKSLSLFAILLPPTADHHALSFSTEQTVNPFRWHTHTQTHTDSTRVVGEVNTNYRIDCIQNLSRHRSRRRANDKFDSSNKRRCKNRFKPFTHYSFVCNTMQLSKQSNVTSLMNKIASVEVLQWCIFS